MLLRHTLIALLIALAPLARGADAPAPAPAPPPRIDVVLWFDTEDYILPASDDAAKRVAELLTEKGVKATFKIVGEKARTLETRGRKDVIEALKKHDIAYHSNYHSRHPTPVEYLAETGLLDGMAEFVRRERGGAEDVKRIFDVTSLSCYGQPGSCWAPQSVAALRQVGVVADFGVPVYLDTGSHIGLDAKPFWYAGALNVYQLAKNQTRYDLHIPQALEPGKQKVTEIAQRLRKEGGGLISIFYHPCEWVHVEFWDGVNFARGANPPREQWKLPRQRTKEETDGAFERFGRYVDHIKRIEGMRFVTARELPGRYPDPVRDRHVTPEDLRELALRIADEKSPGLTYQVFNGKSFSPADQFHLLVWAMADDIGGRGPIAAPGFELLGPDAPPPPDHALDLKVDAAAYRTALNDVRWFTMETSRVPARVFIGADAIPPADFLFLTAQAYLRSGGKAENLPKELRLERRLELLTERHIAKDTPRLYGDWVIHKEGFRAPKLLEVARLQAWTLKPALREEEGAVKSRE
jgi:peptidoglycan/xylan/chitin deacetylase (PgdA/CDA1 family)